MSHDARIGTSWAAATLSSRGCKLYAHRDGWDVELPDGSWRAANTWQELCRIAKELA